MSSHRYSEATVSFRGQIIKHVADVTVINSKPPGKIKPSMVPASGNWEASAEMFYGDEFDHRHYRGAASAETILKRATYNNRKGRSARRKLKLLAKDSKALLGGYQLTGKEDLFDEFQLEIERHAAAVSNPRAHGKTAALKAVGLPRST